MNALCEVRSALCNARRSDLFSESPACPGIGRIVTEIVRGVYLSEEVEMEVVGLSRAGVIPPEKAERRDSQRVRLVILPVLHDALQSESL